MTRKEWARAGHVRRAHGLRGRLALRVYLSEPPLPLEPETPVLLGDEAFTVTRCRITGPQDMLVDLREVTGRERAEGLAGSPLSLRLLDLAEAGQGIPLPALLGMSVPGAAVGDSPPSVTGFHPVRGNPLITVGRGREALDIPLSLVDPADIDWAEGTIGVELPAGFREALQP